MWGSVSRRSRFSVKQEAGLGAARPQLSDEISHAVHQGIAGGSGGLRGIGSGRRRRGSDDGNRLAFYAAMKNQARAHANAAYQDDHFGIELGLGLVVDIVD